MALTFKQVISSETRLPFNSPKIIVDILIFIYLGTSLAICNSDIPFCDMPLKELRQEGKDWTRTCTNGKSQSFDSSCCQAKKKDNLKRMCIYTKICFGEGNGIFIAQIHMKI